MKTRFLIIIPLVFSIFLIWDGFSNNGNIFWNQIFATFEYGGISDEEWEQRYNEHDIVQTFMQKYPDALHSQELDFGFKRLFYIHQKH